MSVTYGDSPELPRWFFVSFKVISMTELSLTVRRYYPIHLGPATDGQ